ncbi:ectoine/hydroxyectoine ABC transporter permease subunit EhuC [Streptomyces sp. PKU-EA00015]|uniref:ectoine/hydroxyectoine ABC transporter permease subunit EhuC n=1 Tax=Streptomyces sp. PKU-EA00015 TaxID=2748326 RepID=UPI0015A3E3A7|nr:ectoine/hydroxyectoine ABC transporter permease subunit EhuC [Streptomyces sp. PKU-EA00015]NWF31313.1 ectoine/hydroxyectoine ABC transporter permease subunit EhuC [Streptomyces sp. PKU-EA00015]
MTAGLWQNWVLPGIWITVQLLVYSTVLAAVVAFGVGTARTHRSRTVRFLAGAYTEIFRGTSALVLMFWLFFVVPPLMGWQLVPMWAAVLALGLSYGAYGAEIVRGALNAVPKAQREAGVALSLTPWERMRLILLPQAVPEMIPPFCNLLIELLKGTALVSLLGVGDVSFAAYLVRLATQESAQIYTISLVIYFLLALAVTRSMKALERRTKRNIGIETEPGLLGGMLSGRAGAETAGATVTGGAAK